MSVIKQEFEDNIAIKDIIRIHEIKDDDEEIEVEGRIEIIEEKEESNSMIHETLTSNPHDLDIEKTYIEVAEDSEEYAQVLAYRASLKKEKEKNEKL